MSITKIVLAGASVLVLVSTSLAADKSAGSENSNKSSGWSMIEDEWFMPLRFESLEALTNASFDYRRGEEDAAANEIDQAVSWLKYAEGHGLPITKSKLTAAKEELEKAAKDLRQGRIADAAMLDASLARAAHALAEWHYYKAHEDYGKTESAYAAQHLEAAAHHLQFAANSAHYQYGPDTVTIFDDVFKDGKLVSHHKTIDHNRLGMHLESIEHAVNELGAALKKTS